MNFLTYKTNKNLLSEMTRIWPKFGPLEYFYNTQTHAIHIDRDSKPIDIGPALTPGDLIIFLQIAWEEKLIKKENTGYCTATIHELIFGFEIFLSTENFETGAIWLLGKLQQIK